MLEEKFKVEKREKTEYPPLPEDMYQVELLDITSDWKPKYKKPDETELKLSFQFTLLDGKDKDGESLRGRNIWRNFVPTYLYIGKKGKNVLYEILEALLGHELSPEEEATMDEEFLNGLVGKQCRVMVKNKKKDDAIYSNIDGFLNATKKLKALTDEEKENARVKNKDNKDKKEGSDSEVDVEDIPF